mgnify:CR=1 FL=1|jgi:hypothetical protein
MKETEKATDAFTGCKGLGIYAEKGTTVGRGQAIEYCFVFERTSGQG